MEAEMAAKLAEMEARCKSNSHRLDALEKDNKVLLQLSGNMELLTEIQQRQEKSLEEVKTDVRELKGMPARRWEQLVDKLGFGAVGSVIGILAGLIINHFV